MSSVKAWELTEQEMIHAQKSGIDGVAAAATAKAIWGMVAWLRNKGEEGRWSGDCRRLATELEQAAIAAGYSPEVTS